GLERRRSRELIGDGRRGPSNPAIAFGERDEGWHGVAVRTDVTVVGAGMAGSEAAWQLAEAGLSVSLVEMKPCAMSPAHQSPLLGELVCSNSLRSDDPVAPAGLLKHELRRAGSLVIACADEHRVPAGQALAVERF